MTPSLDILIDLHEQNSLLIVDTEPIKYIFDFQTHQYTSSTHRILTPMTPTQRQHALTLIHHYLNTTPKEPKRNTIKQYITKIEQISDQTLQKKVSIYLQQQTRARMTSYAKLLTLIFPEKDINQQ